MNKFSITKRRILGLATLGLVIAPVFASSLASANTASTTISSVITANITAFTTSGTVNVNASSASGVKQTVNTDLITISTNDTSGYTLKLQDADTSNALCITPGSSCTGIPSTSATSSSPALMSTANQWGYHIDGTTSWCTGGGSTCGATFGTTLSSNQAASGTLNFAKVPLSSGTADTLKTTATTASGDTTYVWYGVNIDPTQASGTYTDSVTYTATAN